MPTDNDGIENLTEYKKHFEKFLLKQINGSNEDLVLEGKVEDFNSGD
jgi:hypothetical protein